MTPAGFPHSDTPGSTLGCQLPRAYRRLLRPSSALDAKASTMCPSQLVTHTTNPTHQPNSPKDCHVSESDRRCTQHTTKMLASTIQISNNNPTPAHRTPIQEPTDQQGTTKAPHTPTPHHHQPSPRKEQQLQVCRRGGSDSSEPQQCAPTGSEETGWGRR
jgi:hypothetical protein